VRHTLAESHSRRLVHAAAQLALPDFARSRVTSSPTSSPLAIFSQLRSLLSLSTHTHTHTTQFSGAPTRRRVLYESSSSLSIYAYAPLSPVSRCSPPSAATRPPVPPVLVSLDPDYLPFEKSSREITPYRRRLCSHRVRPTSIRLVSVWSM
jgi:hypothetical protein